MGGAFGVSGGFVPDTAPINDQQPSAGATPAAAQTVVQEAPVAAASAPSPSASRDLDSDFDRVFGQKRSGNGSNGRSDGPSSASPASNPPASPSGVPAATAATADAGADDDDEDDSATDTSAASPSPSDQPAQKPLSKAARLHESYKGQIAELTRGHEATVSDLTAKLESLQRQVDEATGKVSDSERQRQANEAAFREVYGDDAEYERLRRINDTAHVTGTYLNNDEAERLARMSTMRTHAEPLRQRYLSEARSIAERADAEARATVERAGAQFQQYIATETLSRAERHGLDPEVVKRAQYGELLDHVAAVTEKRLTEKHAAELKTRDDKISQLEADLQAANVASLADRPAPLVGGNSADVRVTTRRVFDPNAPLDQQWDAAFNRKPAAVRP